MCGIVGINGKTLIQKRLIEGLKRLEYRGYDSTGISCINDRNLCTVKTIGKVSELEKKIKQSKCNGLIGIAHTRWATHGEVSDNNAHPHFTESVSLVHNGIINNFDELKKLFTSTYKIKFHTDTDSEVIVKIIDYYLNTGFTPIQAIQKTVSHLHGAYAVLAIFKDSPDQIIAFKNGAPLGVGCQNGETFVASDSYTISKFAKNITFLEDDDIAIINRGHFEILNRNGEITSRKAHKIDLNQAKYSKGPFKFFMHKEIYEEPSASDRVIKNYIKNNQIIIDFTSLINVSRIDQIIIIACGTSYYAALSAKMWFEAISKIKTNIEIASEFRTKEDFLYGSNAIYIFISQSGETADTLAALRLTKQHGFKTISITNVAHSALSREADLHFSIFAGQEIGVASTKAFINQLITLALISLKLAEIKHTITNDTFKLYIQSITNIPGRIAEIINHEGQYIEIARKIKNSKSALFIGRSVSLAVALEGALKLKELSYIHAEGIAAGELKHGPIALVDNKLPVFALAPFDNNFERIASNIQSVAARKGKIYMISNQQGIDSLKNICDNFIVINDTNIFTTPIFYTVPLQLISYHAALLKGLNVDQPRNLAKSVTVE